MSTGIASAPTISAPAFTMSTQQTIETFWRGALEKVRNGASEVVIPSQVVKIIGDSGVRAIADRYSDTIKARASTFIDTTNMAVRILPPPGFRNPNTGDMSQSTAASHAVPQVNTHGSSQETIVSARSRNFSETCPPQSATVASRLGVGRDAKRKRKTKSEIARPQNSFILYRNHHHSTIVAQHPGLHNNEISKIIGAMWRNEDAETKKEWRAKAAQVKAQHKKDHPDYQYKPRKAAEKQRRMTRAKIAILARSQVDSDLTLENTGVVAADVIDPASSTGSQFFHGGNSFLEYDFNPTEFGRQQFMEAVKDHNIFQNKTPNSSYNLGDAPIVPSVGLAPSTVADQFAYSSILDEQKLLEDAEVVEAENEDLADALNSEFMSDEALVDIYNPDPMVEAKRLDQLLREDLFGTNLGIPSHGVDFNFEFNLDTGFDLGIHNEAFPHN